MERDILDEFQTFYKRYYDRRDQPGKTEIGELVEDQTVNSTLWVDYNDLQKYDSQMADDYLQHPAEMRKYAEQALEDYDIPASINFKPNVRLTNLPRVRERDIGAFHVDDRGQIITVEGQITKQTEVRPEIQEAVFECQRCGAETTVPQNAEFQEPYQCTSCERQGPFQLDTKQSELTNHQLIRLELPPEKARGGGGENVDVNLRGDLVGSANVGDRVVTGVQLEAILKEENDGALLEWTSHGEYVETQDSDWEDFDIDEHLATIEEVANSEDPHQRLVDSIKPTHEGDEHIKLAIALQMFGGVRKELPDGDVKRGDSHILLVGDPGTDKSGLLKYAKKLAPRAIYTSGKSSSGVGLTAAAVRDDFGGGGWTIKGGAMVRAHKGLACIDELDKIGEEDRGSMFEALAEQTISVSKAGENATLPAQTRVLGAANPEMGRFDQHAPIGDQLNLDPAFISRFDLIFIVTDQPDEEKDRSIVQKSNRVARVGGRIQRGEDVDEEEYDDVAPELDPEVIRAYAAYAQQEFSPVLSREATDRIEEFYVNLRSKGLDEDSPVPVTARKIEAIHRLSEASARIRLSNTVSRRDAELAIKIVQDCLSDIGIDPDTGNYDVDIIETGASMSQKKRVRIVKDVIEELESETRRGAPIAEVKAHALQEHKIASETTEHIIEENLKPKGEAYCPTDEHVRLS